MAQYGSSQAQLCDYCHQKPKFAPYNYCGKVCGSRARATGSTPSNNTPMCKQCGQRPVHRGHQFCGRNCANTWQSMNGQISTGGGGNAQPQQQTQSSWNTMPPPPVQNPPSTQISNQGGGDGGGGLKGFVKNLKGLVSQNSPSQQSQSQPKSTTPDPSMISPPITPMSSGMGNSTGMSTPTTPGTNQHYHTPPSPTSPGLPDPNAGGHKSRTTGIATSQSNSTGGDNHDDPDFDPYADQNQVQNTGGVIPIQAQAQFSIQVNSPVMGTGGHGNGGWDPNDPNNFPSQHSTRSNPSATCRLNGCDNPVFVDPVSRRAGEYCSQRHREDAAAFGQASPCIMCQKMPRGQKDHFCSRACREKALRP